MTGFTAAIFIASVFVSFLLTEITRLYALRNSVLDVPNERSLHSSPIPRGGGIAIAVVCLSAFVFAAMGGVLPASVATGAVGGGIAVAVIGWRDDKRHVHPLVRLAVHVGAAAWLVYWLGGYSTLNVGSSVINLGWLGNVLLVSLVVWFINLYNFMDGTDGLAASEALIVALAGGLVLLWKKEVGLGIIALALAGAAAGFLLRNKAPAKIFLGDVGSGLIGFLFAAIAIQSEKAGALPLLGWVVLLGVFIADATFTLIRRFSRGERWYSAHRSHAYQRLVQAGWSHNRVALGALVLNLVLAAFVGAAIVRPSLLPVAIAMAALLLAFIYVRVEQLAPAQPRARRSRI